MGDSEPIRKRRPSRINPEAPPTGIRSAAPSAAEELELRSGDVEGGGEGADDGAPLEDGCGQAGVQSLSCLA